MARAPSGCGGIVVDGSGAVRGSAALFTGTRRAALTTVVLALTLAGHTSAHGMLPGTGGLLLVGVIAASLTLVATSRPRTWAWLFAFLLGTQLLLHVLLVVASGESHMRSGPAPLVPTGWMAVAHIVVSVIAAAVLARGEATLHAWAVLLAAPFLPPVSVLAPIGARRDRVPFFVPSWATSSDPRSEASLRGPPCAACA